MTQAHIQVRPLDRTLFLDWRERGESALIAALLARRGFRPEQSLTLSSLPSPLDPEHPLPGMAQAVDEMAEAIDSGRPITVVGDYDCDGATATAVAIRAFRALGAKQVDFIIPSRFAHGYGISPPVVDAIAALHGDGPRTILTVDNGISAFSGIEAAKARGWRVVVTDHHLPAATRPPADAVVDPIVPESTYPGRFLAGVGVVFLLAICVRSKLLREGVLSDRPPLNDLLDLVAVGTLADMVRLDPVNLALVEAGLQRIRDGKASVGVQALIEISGLKEKVAKLRSTDIGFFVAPRINAAGRMADMAGGIACLLSEDPATALALAGSLDTINRERRAVESDMREQAMNLIQADQYASDHLTTCVMGEGWHEGVVGIVAGRLKDTFGKPTFVFARNDDGTLKGSGRSVEGLHLRDALDDVQKLHPDVLLRFGGHAAAAGCTLRPDGFEAFREAFETVAQAHADALSTRTIASDGRFPSEHWTCDEIDQMNQRVWGQGLAAPLFFDEVEITHQRDLRGGHKAGQLRMADGLTAEFVMWRRSDPLPQRGRVLWSAEVNEWKGVRTPKVTIQTWMDPVPEPDLAPVDPTSDPSRFPSLA